MSRKNYFVFNNINSLDLGLHIEELPIVPTTEESKELIEIDGRNGFLTRDYNCYKHRTYDVEIILTDIEKLDQVKSFLCRSGKLILSNNPDRYYKATIINKIDFKRIFRHYNSCIVTFAIQPFEYETESKAIVVTGKSSINNPTNATCQPILKIYGSGQGTVTIGSDVIAIKAITSYVELDYELQECYRYDGIVLKNCNGDVHANFKEIPTGDTAISFTGGVTKVEIDPRFRWK